MEMTLTTLSQVLIEADFPDLFDAAVDGDILDLENMTGSVTDGLGNRVIEFKILEIHDDETEIVVEFDEDLYKEELINPAEYLTIMDDGIDETLQEIEFVDFNIFSDCLRNPEKYTILNGNLYTR